MAHDPLERVPPILLPALKERGFTELTAVQQAVLAVEHAGKDLRISSQTGSGKTVAMGLILHDELTRVDNHDRVSHPRALIITPTRELTMQVAGELGWLLRDVKARVVSVTGGTSVRGEQGALARGAEVIVGTPGRLLDHLRQGMINTADLTAVVLDEADQMLDLGFRDELEAILEKLPAERRTHLVSATFSSDVLNLARRYQKDAVHVQGTSLGTANVDITHIIHLVRHPQTLDAVINLLLYAPDELTLIFVRTRADAGDLAQSLAGLGFSASALTGEMEQAARTRVMTAFRSGHLRTLVATDVAARGIDVPDVTRVIQADPPTDPEVYTHRSGRTGRAGRKGTSILLVPPQARDRVSRLLQRGRIPFTVQPVPGAEEILAASDERLLKELSVPPPAEGDGAYNPHLHGLAQKLLAEIEPVALVHKLLARVGHRGPCAPRTLETVTVPAPRVRRDDDAPSQRREGPNAWVTFRFTSGSRFGVDARRLLATVCRRGNIRGNQVGAIKIGTVNSTFDVATEVAESFAEAASRRDPRDPKVVIEAIQALPRGDRPAPSPTPVPPPPVEKREEKRAPPVEKREEKRAPPVEKREEKRAPPVEKREEKRAPHIETRAEKRAAKFGKPRPEGTAPVETRPAPVEKREEKRPERFEKRPAPVEKREEKRPGQYDKPFRKPVRDDGKRPAKFEKPGTWKQPHERTPEKPGKGRPASPSTQPASGGARRPQRKPNPKG